ncbi:MAG TPA: cobalamin-dependent protein [Candidatus Saccharimonadales bacterium]|nr:cobalamin-dependent protein [Candidatus Saccharimonadales bacterium]
MSLFKEPRKIGRVLFIYPPLTTHTDYSTESKGTHPPIGISYIAAYLERMGIEVRIIDAVVEGYYNEEPLGDNIIRYGLSFEEITRRVAEFKPDMVGVSNLFSSSAEDSIRVCSAVKAADPRIVTMLGGPHPSAIPEHPLGCSDVDFAMIGEGEIPTESLVKALEAADESLLEGVAFIKDGQMVRYERKRYVEDLDSLPFPARHLLPMDKYLAISNAFLTTKRTPFTPMITSRGCPAKCTFCPVHAAWGKTWRARSAENVIEEIDELVNKYGIREIHFDDDNLTLDKARAMKLFQMMIDRKYDLIWTAPSGIALWALDEELLEKMAESGCYKLFMAIESGDEYVLKHIIRKPLKLKKVLPLARKIRSLGIEMEAFFVVGMPGETKEQLRQTFRFARQLDADNTLYFYANPIPGSPLYEESMKHQYISKEFDYTKLRVSTANLNTPQLSAVDLEKMVARENLRMRLSYMVKHPVRAAERYSAYIRKDPRVVYKTVAGYLRNSLGFAS